MQHHPVTRQPGPYQRHGGGVAGGGGGEDQHPEMYMRVLLMIRLSHTLHIRMTSMGTEMNSGAMEIVAVFMVSLYL